MSGAFSVDPEAVRELTERFSRYRDDLDARIDIFRDKGDEIDEAFGIPTESAEARQAYTETLRDVLEGLYALRDHLRDVSTALDGTVATYAVSDETGSRRFRPVAPPT